MSLLWALGENPLSWLLQLLDTAHVIHSPPSLSRTTRPGPSPSCTAISTFLSLFCPSPLLAGATWIIQDNPYLTVPLPCDMHSHSFQGLEWEHYQGHSFAHYLHRERFGGKTILYFVMPTIQQNPNTHFLLALFVTCAPSQPGLYPRTSQELALKSIA